LDLLVRPSKVFDKYINDEEEQDENEEPEDEEDDKPR